MSLNELRDYVRRNGRSPTSLRIEECDAGLVVHYHCLDPEDAERFLALLAGVSGILSEFYLTGEDAGSNGTRNWDLGSLLDQKPSFRRLTVFEMEGTKPGDHNRTIVTCGDAYEEAGGLGRLLSAAPALLRLVTPSAPDRGFFEHESVLRELVVCVGYDHQGFLKGLAESRCVPQLVSFRYVDYSESYMDDFENGLTPAEDYRALFGSNALPSLRSLSLVNARLANQRDLRSMPLALQLEELEFLTLDI